MRHFVPQGRPPVEIARRAGPGRVHRDHATKAGAQRTDHPGQPEVSDGEVIVAREHLDQDRALHLQVVARRQGVERLLRQREYVLLEYRRLIGMHAHDNVTTLERLELVEGVHHAQQVERDDVERIVGEGTLQRLPSPRLVPRPQQVHAELGVCTTVGRIQLKGPSHQRGGFIEPIGTGGVAAGNAIDVSVGRVDGERTGNLCLEVVRAVIEIRHRCTQRARFEAGRVDLESAVE